MMVSMMVVTRPTCVMAVHLLKAADRRMIWLLCFL